MVTIYCRHKIFVNTDPQRRCYNGAYASYRYDWSDWKEFERTSPEKVKDRLTFWQELNDFAVSQRGEGAKKEFTIVEPTN